jgi:transmembrane sensor
MKIDEQPLTPAVRAEAAAWVARLHSSARTRELEEGFRRWLKANLAHARAFEVATRAWELGASIPAGALPRMARPEFAEAGQRARPRFLSTPRLAVAAALCLVVVGILFVVNRESSTVATQVGEQRMLTLDDGSRVFLNTDTRLSVHYDAERRLVKLEEGEALFDVAKNPERPFIVDAGQEQVRAVGTEFVVRRDPHQIAVTLVEGKVSVSSGAGDSIAPPGGAPAPHTLLVAGQRATFVDNRSPAVDQPPLEAVTAWRRGEVVLDKTRLSDAVIEMNRYSKLKLAIDNPQAADIALSGVFRAGDSRRFAEAVAETYQLRLVQQRQRIVISARRD